MKILIGDVVPENESLGSYLLDIPGLETLKSIPDVDNPPFECIQLKHSHLIRLRKLINKKLGACCNGKKSNVE